VHHIVLQAKRVLSDTAFMRSLEEFDKDNIPDTVISKLKHYIDDPQYQPDIVAKQSKAAMSLCMWTRAMDVYNRSGTVLHWLTCASACPCSEMSCMTILFCLQGVEGR
jgi:hypothetical protein